jgi:hypothetical protein
MPAVVECLDAQIKDPLGEIYRWLLCADDQNDRVRRLKFFVENDRIGSRSRPGSRADSKTAKFVGKGILTSAPGLAFFSVHARDRRRKEKAAEKSGEAAHATCASR